MFKIWPSYFIFLGFVLLVSWPQEGGYGALHSLFPNFIHLQNYLGSPRTHTWSLAVEEHFYLVLPLLLAFAWNKKIGRVDAVPLLLISSMLFCLCFRTIHWLRAPTDNSLHWLTHTRMDSLFFGVLLAYIDRLHPAVLRRVANRPLLALFLAALLLAPQAFVETYSPYIWTIGYTLNFIAFGLILIVCIHTPPNTTLLGKALFSVPSRILGYIGVFSYSIYLWHADVITLLKSQVLPHFASLAPGLRWISFFFVMVVSASVIGILLGKIIEMPMLALRDRLMPRTKGTDESKPSPTPACPNMVSISN